MDDTAFWDLIDSTVATHDDRQGRDQALITALAALPPDEIVDFQVLLDDASAEAWTWLMWGAAYRIFGWCSDDGFDYFRMWLMSLGRTAFAEVIADPDRLVEQPQVRRLSGRERNDWTSNEWPEWETLDYVANKAYQAVTGQSVYDAVDHRAKRLPRRQHPGDERWDFENPEQTAVRLPRLVELFPFTDRQRWKAFDQQLADRGMSPTTFHFGTESGESEATGPERTRSWLQQWRPSDR